MSKQDDFALGRCSNQLAKRDHSFLSLVLAKGLIGAGGTRSPTDLDDDPVSCNKGCV